MFKHERITYNTAWTSRINIPSNFDNSSWGYKSSITSLTSEILPQSIFLNGFVYHQNRMKNVVITGLYAYYWYHYDGKKCTFDLTKDLVMVHSEGGHVWPQSGTGRLISYQY